MQLAEMIICIIKFLLIQIYVIKFVSDLWQVSVFLRVLRFFLQENWPPQL
jgi:hypothetical protein